MPFGTWFPGQNANPAGPGGVRVFNENVIVNGWVLSQKGVASYPPAVTSPGTVASASTVNNPTGYDCMVYAQALLGGIGSINVGGVAAVGTVGVTSWASVYVPANSNINVTYTGNLTWHWLAV